MEGRTWGEVSRALKALSEKPGKQGHAPLSDTGDSAALEPLGVAFPVFGFSGPGS